MRTYKISSIPPGFYLDEGMYGLIALDIIKGIDRLPYFDRIYGVDAMFAYLTAVSFNLFEPKPQSIRIVSAFVGVVTVFGTYLLLKTILNQNVAIFSCILLAFSRWHITISRIGFQVILLPLFMVFGFYWFFKGLKSKKQIDFILSGLAIGLGFYTYLPFRLVPIILFLILIYKIVFEKSFLKVYFKSIILLIIVMIFVSLPLWIYFLYQPQLFFLRASTVAQLTAKEILSNFVKVWLMFGFVGDPEPRHNIPNEPMLSPPVFVIFILGIVCVIYYFYKCRAKRNIPMQNSQPIERLNFIFMFLWFFIMLLPSVFSADAPHALRTFGVVPVVYAFCGFFLNEMLIFIKKKSKKISVIFLSIFLVWVCYCDLNLYFHRWAKLPEVQSAFGAGTIEIFNKLKPLASQFVVFLPISLYSFPSITFFLKTEPTKFYCIYNSDSFVFEKEPQTDILYVVDLQSENGQRISKLLRLIYPKIEKFGEIKINQELVLYELYLLKKEQTHRILSEFEKSTIESILSPIRKVCALTPWLKDQLYFCKEKRNYSG